MFKFTFDEKEYILDDENFDELINDDEKPVKNEFSYKRNGRLCKYYLCKNDKIRTTKRNNC